MAVVLLLAGTAQAYRIVDKEEMRLEVWGWAQAGYALIQEPGTDFRHQPYLGIARLAGLVDSPRWGGAFIQFASDTGDIPELLDAIAYIRPIQELELRVGKFRTPLSFDRLIGAPFTPFVNRSLSIDLTEARLMGAEAIGTYDFGPLTATLQAGWFARGALDSPGSLLSLRMLLAAEMGLSVHLAYMDEVDPPSDRPAAELSQQLDLAIQYQKDGFTLRLEGVVAFRRPEPELPVGGYIELLYAIPLPKEQAIEPAVHYGAVRRGDSLRQKATFGVNWYIFGDYLNATLNYELLVTDGVFGHAAFFQLQGGY